MEIGHVDVHGLRINLPPKSHRKDLPKLSGKPAGRVKIFVDEIRATDTVLTLGTDKPGKVPLEFDIQHLLLKSVGAGQPLHFVATLINPKPIGDIQSTGSFGPWNSDDPRQTPLNGSYSFSNANLGTLKGIGGILSSTGHYQGMLDNIAVDGSTDTPDFEVGISGHKVALHTDFHAVVDGTNGDTYLKPVDRPFSPLVADRQRIRGAHSRSPRPSDRSGCRHRPGLYSGSAAVGRAHRPSVDDRQRQAAFQTPASAGTQERSGEDSSFRGILISPARISPIKRCNPGLTSSA